MLNTIALCFHMPIIGMKIRLPLKDEDFVMRNWLALALLLAAMLAAGTMVLAGTSNSPSQAPVNFTVIAPGSVVIKSLQFTPDPPSVRQRLTLMMHVTASDMITEGAHIRVTTSVGNMQIDRRDIDVCKEAARDNHPCPLAPGDRDLNQSFELPDHTPPFVTLKIDAEAHNADGSLLFHIQFPLKLVP